MVRRGSPTKSCAVTAYCTVQMALMRCLGLEEDDSEGDVEVDEKLRNTFHLSAGGLQDCLEDPMSNSKLRQDEKHTGRPDQMKRLRDRIGQTNKSTLVNKLVTLDRCSCAGTFDETLLHSRTRSINKLEVRFDKPCKLRRPRCLRDL